MDRSRSDSSPADNPPFSNENDNVMYYHLLQDVHHRTKSTAARPAMPRAPSAGKPRAQFMLHIPYNEYLFPQGIPINATIADIIVILPQWFRNPGIIFRFLNNGITAAVHFAILEEHRYLDWHTPEESERARDHLSDSYRKVMRKFDPRWRKAGHQAPEDWDQTNLSINNFVPEASKQAGYMAPPSIPFKDLAVGLKKLPRGLDAGDVTRTLDYALHNVKADQHGRSTEFMFPDDIQLILSHIGGMDVTQGHLDRGLIARYANVLREADAVRRKQAAEARLQREQEAREMAHQLMSLDRLYSAFPQPALRQQVPYQLMPHVLNFAHQWGGHGEVPPQDMGVFQPTQAEQPLYIFPTAQQASGDLPDIPAMCKWDGGNEGQQEQQEQQEQQGHEWLFPQDWTEEQQMDALMAANQTPDASILFTPSSDTAPYKPPGNSEWGLCRVGSCKCKWGIGG